MDQRGHQLPDSSRRSHRKKDKERYSRSTQQEWDLNQSMPDQHWAPPDAHYMTHFTGPPARPQPFPYHSQEYAYGYGWQEHHTPQSRHGYDYPSRNYWDYRDSYGYYDYHRGQHAQQDGVQWGPQESWQTSQYPERTPVQGLGASLTSEEHRYDKESGSPQHYPSDHQVDPSRKNEDISSYYAGTLESSKTSGLSSSSYELSQYMNGSNLCEPDVQPAFTSHGGYTEAQSSAPLKYSIPHAVVSFGPAGQLIRIAPALSAQEKFSQLEIHSLELILSETQEQQEMRNFPGPLTREDLHKVDAIDFAHQKAGACMRDGELPDRSSAALLWNLLILLCRQNGQIVGSDVAELLMQDSNSDGSWKPEVPTLIDFDEPSAAEALPAKGDDLLTGDPSSLSCESPEKALQGYTQLLLAGRKKEALESAMASGLWGHALFLASKMGNRSYATVLSRFTSQLVASDPLQTLFQLLSGRIPAASVCCGNEKWGDWRPHLAVMLSNETGNPAVQQKAILTMGDSLASRGLIHAAHVCYLTAGASFGAFPQKTERLVLLGSSHRQTFGHFASNSAIQCTELYEYCQTLGGKSFSIPSFQAYKFLYASRLLDCGLSSQAFHYCEVVGRAVLRQPEPDYVLTEEIIKLADRLRFSEGQYSEAGFSGAAQEPEWLKHLRTQHQRLQMGIYDGVDINQPAAASHVFCEDSQLCPEESDRDDLSCNNQDPEPELLYFRSSEHQDTLIHETGEETKEVTVMSLPDKETQHRPHANAPFMPTMVVHTPSVPMSQNLIHHDTDGVEVRSYIPHCPPSNLSLAADKADTSPVAGTMHEVNFGDNQNQRVIPEAAEDSEGPKEVPKQSSKTGWFSGWFKSKPKDAQENTKNVPDQMEPLPPAGPHPPPPPSAALPAGPFPPSPAGINPFSRKAGLQPR